MKKCTWKLTKVRQAHVGYNQRSSFKTWIIQCSKPRCVISRFWEAAECSNSSTNCANTLKFYQTSPYTWFSPNVCEFFSNLCTWFCHLSFFRNFLIKIKKSLASREKKIWSWLFLAYVQCASFLYLNFTDLKKKDKKVFKKVEK